MGLIANIKKISSTKEDLKSFGKVVGIAFFILSGILYWLGKSAWPWTLCIGAFLLIAGLIFPVILKPFQKAWMTLAILMGSVVTPIVLSILFYLVLSPMGIIAKLMRKDLLNEKITSNETSYWVHKKNTARRPEDYEKQF